MCNCSAKKAGKLIAGFAGITVLFSVIVMIIAAVTLQFHIDPETMQKCGNSRGAYTTKCSNKAAKRRLGREVHDLQTIPSVTWSSWSTAAKTAAYFEDAMQATFHSMERHANVETKENTGERSLREFLLGKDEKKAAKERLLFVPVRGNATTHPKSDDCTMRKNFNNTHFFVVSLANNGECNDPSKKAFTYHKHEYTFCNGNCTDVNLTTAFHDFTAVGVKGVSRTIQESCSANTDTTDCGELLESSVCEVGKCCCKCGSSDADAVDIGSYEASKRGEYNYCFDSDCATKLLYDKYKMPVAVDKYKIPVAATVCGIKGSDRDYANGASAKSRYIVTNRHANGAAITPTCNNTEDVSGTYYKSKHSCTHSISLGGSCKPYTINGKRTMLDATAAPCAGTRCTNQECCIEDPNPKPDGCDAVLTCKKCCGVNKTMACSGTDDSIQRMAFINQTLKEFQGLVNYGSLACMVGVLPAIAGAAGKMKNHNCVGNTCGVLSLFSTEMLSVGTTGAVAVYMTFVGAILHSSCSTIYRSFGTYKVGTTCNKECLAAQKHLIDAICNLGDGIVATSVLMFLSWIFAISTSISVCVGFCNNKNKKQEDVIQAVVVVPQSAPVAQTITVPQIAPVAQAVNVKTATGTVMP